MINTYEVSGLWYFTLYTGVTIGPFDTKEEAISATLIFAEGPAESKKEED